MEKRGSVLRGGEIKKTSSSRAIGSVRGFNDYIAGTSIEEYSTERAISVFLGRKHQKLKTVPPSDKYL